MKSSTRLRHSALAAGVAFVIAAALVAVAMGSPPSGVTPTVLARGTYDAFKVRSYPQGPGDFKAEAKAPTDIVDTGEGHIGRNESGQPARDVTVIIAPVGGSFRGELDAPSPNCNF